MRTKIENDGTHGSTESLYYEHSGISGSESDFFFIDSFTVKYVDSGNTILYGFGMPREDTTKI